MALTQELRESADVLCNSHLKKWKEQGGKIVAYYCPFVPEEMLVAAGAVPFALRATGSVTSHLISSMI